MDKLFRDTVLAGLTIQEIAEMVGLEWRRRGLTGVLYAFPTEGGNGVFTAVAHNAVDLNASQILQLFARYASLATSEKHVRVDDAEAYGPVN